MHIAGQLAESPARTALDGGNLAWLLPVISLLAFALWNARRIQKD